MSDRLRVLLLAPHPLGEPRGNSVTLMRFAATLRAAGARVRLLGPDQPDPSASLRAGPRQTFDIIHAFHATKAGPRALRMAERSAAPCVITLTGTDINLDLGSRARQKRVERVLTQARALVAFHPAMRNNLRRRRPLWATKTHVIPAAVAPRFFACGETESRRQRLGRRWRRRFGWSEGELVLLWPGGIRAVKDPMLPLRAFSGIRRQHPRARLLFLGPILEPAYGRRFLRALRGVPGAHYQPAVAPGEMPGVHAAADVVINSSLSEGMSNSLLEAMAVGVPVLARANDGNRALVTHNRTGLLFSNQRQFVREAGRLLREVAFRKRLARQARRRARRRHSAAAECAAYLRLYRKLLEGKPRA